MLLALSYNFQYKQSPENSVKKAEIFKQISRTMAQRAHLADSINMIGKILFEPGESHSVLNSRRDPALPLVDDWDCLKSMVKNSDLPLYCDLFNFLCHGPTSCNIYELCRFNCLRHIVGL